MAEGSDSASPLWERWLTSLAFDASSPAVLHLRHLGTSPGLERALRHAFEALDEQKAGCLDLDGLLRFSHGLRGQLHALGDRGHSMPLLDVDWRDAAFLKCSFSTLFPPHSPLSADDFIELAKLLLLRRVVRTLAATRGMASLRRGLASPLVATLELELTGEKRLRLLHTIAPASRPAAVGGAGERLGTLAE